MRKTSSFPALLFCAVVAVGIALAYVPYAMYRSWGGTIIVVCAAFVMASIVASAIKVAAPWDRAVVLRLGRFRTPRGAGVFGIIPIIDTIPERPVDVLEGGREVPLPVPNLEARVHQGAEGEVPVLLEWH
jgi:hypothetical protein